MNARSSIVPRGINPWRICGSMNGFGDTSLIYIMQPTEFNVDSEGLKDKGGSREGVVRRGEAKVFLGFFMDDTGGQQLARSQCGHMQRLRDMQECRTSSRRLESYMEWSGGIPLWLYWIICFIFICTGTDCQKRQKVKIIKSTYTRMKT